jgi:G3E family GTPase
MARITRVQNSGNVMRVSTAVSETTRLPLTIVGGDAGAGKTTLLKQLAGQEHLGGVAVVLDDSEPPRIDPALVARVDGPWTTLTNGSVCGVLAGDLSAELAELRPRLGETIHVLVEARGDGALRRTAGYGYMPGYRLDGIIVVVDVRDIHRRLEDPALRAEMRTALLPADILVINKLDVLEPGKRALHQPWIDDQLPQLRVVETSRGRVAGSLLLGLSPEVARRDPRTVPGNWETTTYRTRAHRRSSRAAEQAEPPCRVWHIETDEPISAQRFRRWVSLLPRTVVRGGGDVLIEDDPQVRYHFNMIGHRWQLQREQPWGLAAPETQVTLVGM